MKTKIVLKAQSAMEYLMTYGWAILIISVVLASLFSLGVFNSGTSLSTACIAFAGYTCSAPLLHTGTLSVTVGQATGYAWSNTVFYYDATGSSGCFGGTNTITYSTFGSSQTSPVTFGGFGNTAGTAYGGSLWASYDTATVNNLCVQLATLSLKEV